MPLRISAIDLLKLRIHLGADKTKSILFASQHKIKNIKELM